MKVKIRDLRANPFRGMGHYPVDRAKVRALMKSIRETSFWDNILARPKDGTFEIAYGHHRLLALWEIFGKDSSETVDIPVRHLDDDLMLKIMANENATEWETGTQVVLETVKAVRAFLLESGGLAPGDPRSKQASRVAKFLGGTWTDSRVQEALSILGAVQEKIVEERVIKKIPRYTQARDFVQAVKRSDTRIPMEDQRKVADKLAKEEVGRREIRQTFQDMGYQAARKEWTPQRDLEPFLKRMESLAVELTNKLIDLINQVKGYPDTPWPQPQTHLTMMALWPLVTAIEELGRVTREKRGPKRKLLEEK